MNITSSFSNREKILLKALRHSYCARVIGGRRLVTLEPEHVFRHTLLGMDLIVAIGKDPQKGEIIT